MQIVKTSNGSAPSSLMGEVLRSLRELKRTRNMSFEEIEKKGGKGQQAWSKWEAGADPSVSSIASTANALDAELVLEVRDRRKGTHVSAAPSPEAVEIATVVDALEESARQRVVSAVHRLAQTLAGVPARKQGKAK